MCVVDWRDCSVDWKGCSVDRGGCIVDCEGTMVDCVDFSMHRVCDMCASVLCEDDESEIRCFVAIVR